MILLALVASSDAFPNMSIFGSRAKDKKQGINPRAEVCHIDVLH